MEMETALMNNCEYAEKSVFYNVDKILKVF